VPDEEKKEAAQEIPKREPGVLCGVEWTKAGTIDCSEPEQNGILDLLTKLNARESPARREQIIRVWEKRLFDRGFQHILPQRTGGWSLPAAGTGYGYGEEGSKSTFETNIYNSYKLIIIAALTREIPTVRFKPKRPNSDAGITAAQNAEALNTDIDRTNKMLTLLEDNASLLWTDGMSIFDTFYMKDGQLFGYKEPDDDEDEDVVPESGEGDDADAPRKAKVNGDDGDENPAHAENEEGRTYSHEPGYKTEATGPTEDTEGKEPLGREVIEVGGALEWSLPIKANKLTECGYAINSREIDTHLAKAKFPHVAEKITQSKGGPGGDNLDRLARINVLQGMMDSYNTQDSEANEVTWQRAFIRPWQLLELNDSVRDSVIKKFPHGLYVQFCGNIFCEARDQSMDQRLTLMHSLPGNGMNRPGIGDWLMPIQKCLNNWIELANDYFVRGVPAKWMDNEMFDVEANQDQVNAVGEVHPFDREPGVEMNEVIFEETPPQFPEQLMAFIQDFKGDLAQLLCGAFPALYGGDTGANDTMGGITVQRDQALGRIGLPWRRLKEAVASMKLQAVQCLAQNHDEPISVSGKITVTVEMADLHGDMLAFPDVDESYPETQTQKSNRVVELVQEATANPFLAKLMDDPDNLELIKDSSGLKDFKIAALQSRNKQLGEIEIMLQSGPVPNPQIGTLEKQLKQIEAAAMQPENTDKHDAMIQQAMQLQQQIDQIKQAAPEVSSEEVDPQCDDHETEAATTLSFINSPQGRTLKNGDDDERDSFKNIRLHYLEHVQAIAAKKAAAAADAMPGAKPPSISANIKDMTPGERVQALAKTGIKSDEQTVAQDQATKLAAEHPHEQVPVPA
jgi:hypothetical protein